uniref:Uncharacterized protein n=1 Tax=Rhizophora mucronata TaxID=61149 RepID=A0A2P2J2K9_RHIMU
MGSAATRPGSTRMMFTASFYAEATLLPRFAGTASERPSKI